MCNLAVENSEIEIDPWYAARFLCGIRTALIRIFREAMQTEYQPTAIVLDGRYLLTVLSISSMSSMVILPASPRRGP